MIHQKVLREELFIAPANPEANVYALLELDKETRDDIITWDSCTTEEVRGNIFLAENTALGIDKIPPTISNSFWLTHIKLNQKNWLKAVHRSWSTQTSC